MDGIKQQIHAKQIEAIDTKHMYETRKKNRQLRAELDKINEAHKETLQKVKKDFNRTELDEKNKLEADLTGIRNKNQKMIKEEKLRFEKMVEEIQITHKEKIAELKMSQDKEIEKQSREHGDYLDTARSKYEAEKMKLEA